MGISGLLPALKSIERRKQLSNFAGQTIAIDGYGWLHKAAYTCAADVATGRPTAKYVEYVMERVRLLRHFKVEPYLVFDGGELPAKKGTESKRQEKRTENLARAKALDAQGKSSEAYEYYTKCVDVTPQMAYQVIKALKVANVEFVVAPYEADAQLAYLEHKGVVNGVLTEDSDLLVFGCQNVLFKLDSNTSSAVQISRKDFARVCPPAAGISLVNWSDAQFRAMAILSGCDYLPSIPGIGLKTACNLLRKHKTAEKVVKAILREGKKKVPNNYLEKYHLADKCFQHQRVYCPVAKELVHLKPVEDQEGWTKEFDDYCGGNIEPEMAQKLARGEVDPDTLLPMVDINPNYRPGTGAKPLSTSKQPNQKGKAKEAKPAPNGGIYSFFGPNPIIPREEKPSRKAVALPIKQQPKNSSTGKASGKRTLADVMDEDIARKKPKQRQSTPGNFSTQSKFFPVPHPIEGSRRHSSGAYAGPSRLRDQSPEKENVVPEDMKQPADEPDSSEVSLCAQRYTSELDLDFDDHDMDPQVEQEDGYISPMAPSSPSRDVQDLSSPVHSAENTPRRQNNQPESIRNQSGFRPFQRDARVAGNEQDIVEALSSPTSANKPSHRFRSYSPRIVSSPITYADGSPQVLGDYGQRRSAFVDLGEILVEDTPVAKRLFTAATAGPSCSASVSGVALDLRSTLGIGRGREAIVVSDDSANSSYTATPPSASPPTPLEYAIQDRRVVIDVDELDIVEIEEKRLIKAQVRKEDFLQSFSYKPKEKLKTNRVNKSTPPQPTGKGKTKGSVAVPSKLKRSNTNITPNGQFSFGKVNVGRLTTPAMSSPAQGRSRKAGGTSGKKSPTILSFWQPQRVERTEPIVVPDSDDEIVSGVSPVAIRRHHGVDVAVDSVAKSKGRLAQFQYRP
ncbi:hypothetical protein FA15DRAFT_623405 [Coprinopsis marcescibilis]|uniref:Uncharacterized protein n=1 Tax=Coprinopsis marcescibilis TaxID=230819 RepID=A0A5C3KMY5_COPMA|nr:hypothetical protein FA15DRAFT_623405 [Coprinopsis marcescibilis]